MSGKPTPIPQTPLPDATAARLERGSVFVNLEPFEASVHSGPEAARVHVWRNAEGRVIAVEVHLSERPPEPGPFDLHEVPC